MKNKNIKYLFLAVLAIAFVGCEDDLPTATFNSDATLNPSASDSEIVLTEEMVGTDVLTISWEEPDYGFQASPAYTIYLDKSSDFSDPRIISIGTSTSKTFKSEELNGILLNLDFDPAVSGTMHVRVDSKLSTFETITSDVFTVDITPYSSFLDLSTTWGIVGSGYNNWGQFPDAPFFTTSTANVIVAYVTLLDGEIKFRENNEWGNNVGDNGGDGTLESGGANIVVTAGTYKVTFNTAANTYTKEPYSWGIVGSAYNDWGATPDFRFDYDDSSDKWRAIVKLSAGEFKIRKNNEWGTNYGDDGANGTLEAGGANLVVEAGKYQITFDEKNLTIEIIPIDNIWGLVGSAYNNWGATPDAAFTRDWRNDNVWILKDKYVALLAGEFKFRDGNEWATNYGDDGANGSLEAGGANIVSTVNVYYITLDFNASPPTYVAIKY